MIHLDRNHPSAPFPRQHKPDSLILQDPPRTDQRGILPWPSTPDDPSAFYHQSQDLPLTLPTPQPTDGPSSPADAQDPALPRPSPGSPTDSKSPPPDTSPSLSPATDAVTPHSVLQASEEQPENVQTENNTTIEEKQEGEDMDRASRQSTPLSELSSAPDVDETPDKDDAGTDGNDSSNPDSSKSATSPATLPNQRGTHVRSPSSQSQLSVGTGKPSPNPNIPTGQQPPFVNGDQNAASAALGLGAVDTPLQLTSSTSAHSQSSHSPAKDPKVVNILELNALLLRVAIEYQARGTMSDPIFNEYSTRLQSNLTWLAAAADEKAQVAQGRHTSLDLPIMQAPPVIEFVEMPRIMELYRELPKNFAKDLARRQQATIMSPDTSSMLPGHGSVKRERTEELGLDGSSKRRDTGETKPQTPGPFSTTMPGNSNPIPAAFAVAPSQSPVPNMGGAIPHRSGTPSSMPPPPVPSSAHGSMNDTMAAAARARQAQMRQAALQQEGNRQMSPPSGIPGPIAGPSSMPALSQLTPQQLTTLQALGPQAATHYQALQTPNHPFVQYMTTVAPNFHSLSLPEKLQRMIFAQGVLHARRTSGGQTQGQSGASMGGVQQSGMQTAGASSSQLPGGGGSPTRMSPVMQQQSMQQPSFPFPNQVSNPGSDMRMGMTPQQQAAFASMNGQQKQLFLMQQQLRANPGMMNPQMMAAAQERMRMEQQQRMTHAGSPPNAGSPPPSGIDPNQFPALRSNPTMPGVSRNSRTPSDSAPSPVSQARMSSHGAEDQQRAMMMQQMQRGMTPQMQNSGFPSQGGSNGVMGNSGWPQSNTQQMSQMGQGPFMAQSPSGNGYGGVPSPAGGNQMQMWNNGGGGGGQFPYMTPSPGGNQHQMEGGMPARQASGTPLLHQQMAQGTPTGDPGQVDLDGLEFFNWGQ